MFVRLRPSSQSSQNNLSTVSRAYYLASGSSLPVVVYTRAVSLCCKDLVESIQARRHILCTRNRPVLVFRRKPASWVSPGQAIIPWAALVQHVIVLYYAGFWAFDILESLVYILYLLANNFSSRLSYNTISSFDPTKSPIHMTWDTRERPPWSSQRPFGFEPW